MLLAFYDTTAQLTSLLTLQPFSPSQYIFRWEHLQLKNKCTNADIAYPWPIFSILVYFRLGSPMETMVRNFSMISSSVIFFFFVPFIPSVLSPQRGQNRRRYLFLFSENPEPSIEAWSRWEHSFICFAFWQELCLWFLLSLYFQLHFSQFLFLQK